MGRGGGGGGGLSLVNSRLFNSAAGAELGCGLDSVILQSLKESHHHKRIDWVLEELLGRGGGGGGGSLTVSVSVV